MTIQITGAMKKAVAVAAIKNRTVVDQLVDRTRLAMRALGAMVVAIQSPTWLATMRRIMKLTVTITRMSSNQENAAA
jgi:hypothetical protein